MIHINLLPFRAARKKENIRRQISVFVLMFALTAVTMIYYNGILSSKIESLETETRAKKAELATYQKVVQEIGRIKKRLADLKRKTGIIIQLKKNRDWPVSFLDSINNLVIEKRMWLTSLQMSGARISIKGIALDNKTVADFMTRLEEAKLYTNINLDTINQKTIRKYNLKSFDIRCQKAAPPNAGAKNGAKK